MKRKIVVLIVVLSVFALLPVGCERSSTGANMTVTAYGTVGNCIGEVSLTTDKSGAVVDMTVEEYYTPHNLFLLSEYDRTLFGEGQTEKAVLSDGKNYEYIKTVSVGGETFTLYKTELKDKDGKSYKTPRFSVDYSSKNKKSLKSYISTDEGGEYFVKMLKRGEVTAGIVVNGKYQAVAQAKYLGGINKSCTGFWSEDLSESKGWALNVQLFKTKMIKEFNKNEVNKPDKDYTEEVKTASGATFSSFEDYVYIAYKAYKKLTSK